MHTAFGQDHPFALHYPRDAGFDLPAVDPTPIPVGEGELLRDGEDLLIVGFGPIVMRGMEVAEQLAAEGWSVGLINARFAKPLDRELILDNARGKKLIVTLEESVAAGGFGSAVLELIAEASLEDETLRGLPVRIIGLPGDKFVDHGAVGDLRRTLRLDVDGIAEQIRDAAAALGLPTAAGIATRKSAKKRTDLTGDFDEPALRAAAAKGRLRRKSQRLDDLVVASGLAADRDQAARLLLAGQLKVGEGDGARIDRKPGELVDALTPIEPVQRGRFVSRGGEKLDAALEEFGIDVAGKDLPRRRRLDGRLHRCAAAAGCDARLCSRRGTRTARRDPAERSAGRFDGAHARVAAGSRFARPTDPARPSRASPSSTSRSSR